MKRLVFVVALLSLTGCPKKDGAIKPAPSESDAAIASAAPSASASTSAAPVAASMAWTGPYTLTAGTLSIPTDNKDYAHVAQAKDDPSKLMGNGTIELEVDPKGVVSGTIEGAAGPALVSGEVVDGEIRGQVRRKDPKDDGLTGTLSAKINADSAEGALHLSEGNAAIVREAKITLKKK